MKSNQLLHNFHTILQRIRTAELQFHRPQNSVSLLAVSKTQPSESLATLVNAGQLDMGENYVQEALDKISALSQRNIVWHFIGAIQSNKTKIIAQNFSWIHTVCQYKIAKSLADHRPAELPPLQICIQVKLDNNPKKSGLPLTEVADLLSAITTLPRLKVRGLMTLPPRITSFEEQRKYFNLVQILFRDLNDQGANLDTLSMGMTHDLEAAIAAGATIVRVGTGIFGERQGSKCKQ